MNNENRLSTKEMVLVGLMIALTYIAGSIIKIPSVGGFVHIGDCMVFLSVVVLGKKKGALASGLGMLLVDVLGGYYLWAPFTLIIKGIMAYITGAIIEGNGIKNLALKYITAFAAGGIFMVVGYFAAGTIMSGFLTEKAGLIQGIVYASKDIIGNIIQVVTGMVIAIPLSTVVIKAKQSVFAN